MLFGKRPPEPSPATIGESCLLVTLTKRREYFWRPKTTFVELRDEGRGKESPVELYSLSEWQEFCKEAPFRPESPGGGYRVGDLWFTTPEWKKFLDGLGQGKYHWRSVLKAHREVMS